MNARDFLDVKAICDAGSLRRAAAALGISQPTLSNRVAHLEGQIGAPLFRRRRGQSQPTELALFIAGRAWDTTGAEHLLGMGDMLFLPPGVSKLIRLHGAYVSENEIRRIVDFIKAQRAPVYLQEIAKHVSEPDPSASGGDFLDDPKYDEAVELLERSQAIALERLGPDHPDNPAGWVNLGVLANLRGKPDQALAHCERARASMDRTPADTAIYRHAMLTCLGKAYLGLDQPAKARPLLEAALATGHPPR